MQTLGISCFGRNLNFSEILQTLFLSSLGLKLNLFLFFRTKLYLGEIGPKKNPKMGHLMDAALPRKHLKFHNLTTTSTIKMIIYLDYAMIIYLHKTFHLE